LNAGNVKKIAFDIFEIKIIQKSRTRVTRRTRIFEIKIAKVSQYVNECITVIPLILIKLVACYIAGSI
jgi:hypothetical protein